MIDDARRAIDSDYIAARYQSEAQLIARELEVAEKDQRLFEMISRRKDCLPRAAMLALRDPARSDAILRQAQADSAALGADIRARLTALNYPEDYLTLKRQCDACADTGFLPSDERCSCFIVRVKQLVQLNADLTQSASFEAFDEGVFSDVTLPGLEYSQRGYMARLKDASVRFAERFPNNPKPHILLSGRTGVGKSYLIDCITRRATERGYSVIKLPAYKLIDILRRSHVGQDTEWEIKRLYECDLLAIDDLGTEPMIRNVTIEYLFMILNERMAAQKSLVIATNLGHGEVAARYNERIASRLTDASRVMWFELCGEDLRTRNKGEQKYDK